VAVRQGARAKGVEEPSETTPAVEIVKRLVVEVLIANAGALVAMPVTSTESFANGVVEPMPIKLEVAIKIEEVAVSEVEAVAKYGMKPTWPMPIVPFVTPVA